MKNIVAFLVITISSIIFSFPVSAQYGQYGQPSPELSILVNKTVAKPNGDKGGTSGSYVDNLSPTDPRFKANQEVFFKVTVKNTSNTTLSNVTLKDFVPLNLNPLEGPGSYDSSTRTIAYSIGDMGANEEKTFYFKMQVAAQDQLPADKGLFCIVNKTQAYNDKVSDDDTSQLCIEKQVTGVPSVPTSGPEMGILLLGLNLAGIGAGIFLKKKVN